jgi:Putative adhesin
MPTFATPGPIAATLTTAGARVQVAASDRPDTVVRVEPVNSASKSDVKVAENTEVDFSAGELAVKTKVQGDKNGSVAITINLPAGSRLVLQTARTDVRTEGLLGDCELNMASGKVELDHIAALQANLAGGEVAIGHIAGTASIEDRSAALRIGEVAGTVRYEGATGTVWIGHARSDVELSSARGSFDIDRADGSVIAKSGNCPIRVGRLTRGQAELMNASGGIDIGIGAGTAAWVDAKSTKGEVRNTLSEQDSPGGSENQVKVYARTRLDDIVIHRAAS